MSVPTAWRDHATRTSCRSAAASSRLRAPAPTVRRRRRRASPGRAAAAAARRRTGRRTGRVPAGCQDRQQVLGVGGQRRPAAGRRNASATRRLARAASTDRPRPAAGRRPASAPGPWPGSPRRRRTASTPPRPGPSRRRPPAAHLRAELELVQRRQHHDRGGQRVGGLRRQQDRVPDPAPARRSCDASGQATSSAAPRRTASCTGRRAPGVGLRWPSRRPGPARRPSPAGSARARPRTAPGRPARAWPG